MSKVNAWLKNQKMLKKYSNSIWILNNNNLLLHSFFEKELNLFLKLGFQEEKNRWIRSLAG